jgi:hypothetical protein
VPGDVEGSTAEDTASIREVIEESLAENHGAETFYASSGFWEIHRPWEMKGHELVAKNPGSASGSDRWNSSHLKINGRAFGETPTRTSNPRRIQKE